MRDFSSRLETHGDLFKSGCDVVYNVRATLLDLLWQDPPARPSTLIVVGHLEARTIPAEPDSPRVVMVPASEWLTRSELADRALNSLRWAQPRPVVMLMACESFGLDASTVNDFITSLSNAGAGAIVGAEAEDYPSHKRFGGMAMQACEESPQLVEPSSERAVRRRRSMGGNQADRRDSCRFAAQPCGALQELARRAETGVHNRHRNDHGCDVRSLRSACHAGGRGFESRR